jgi:hypothetical protein
MRSRTVREYLCGLNNREEMYTEMSGSSRDLRPCDESLPATPFAAEAFAMLISLSFAI